jgi:tripeptidyl-peptidase-2
MNGTSMSSPNAAGCIALMVSGLLHKHVPYNVQIIRRAIQNTAAAIVGATDTFGTGYGMIQVRSAFEHVLLQHAVRIAGSFAHGMHPEPFLEVTIPNGGAGSGEPTDKGIYRRDQSQSELAEDVSVTINPTWTEDVSNEAKFGYQLSLELVPTAAGWISCPERVLVMNGGRSFLAHINPRDLLPGSVNFAEILAYEHLPEPVVRAVLGGDNVDIVSGAVALRRSLGPLLRIPATVIKPESPRFTSAGCEYIFTERESTHIPLIPGAVHRRFIAVPVGATWAEIRVHRTDSGSAMPIDALMSATTPALSSIVGAHSRDVVDTSSRTVVVHAMQVVRHLSAKTTSHEEYLYMRPHSRDALAIPVISNTTLEIVLAQFW